MAVIQPGLFLILQRFPQRKEALRQLYRTSDTFQAICHSYQQCTEALDYWSISEHAEARSRQREYTELKNELEREIIQSLDVES